MFQTQDTVDPSPMVAANSLENGKCTGGTSVMVPMSVPVITDSHSCQSLERRNKMYGAAVDHRVIACVCVCCNHVIHLFYSRMFVLNNVVLMLPLALPF